jgi:hypothetical protein
MKETPNASERGNLALQNLFQASEILSPAQAENLLNCFSVQSKRDGTVLQQEMASARLGRPSQLETLNG